MLLCIGCIVRAALNRYVPYKVTARAACIHCQQVVHSVIHNLWITGQEKDEPPQAAKASYMIADRPYAGNRADRVGLLSLTGTKQRQYNVFCMSIWNWQTPAGIRQRGERFEAHISAEQASPAEGSRLPQADEHESRPAGAGSAPAQREKTPVSVRPRLRGLFSFARRSPRR